MTLGSASCLNLGQSAGLRSRVRPLSGLKLASSANQHRNRRTVLIFSLKDPN